jgi:hypothetical protein
MEHSMHRARLVVAAAAVVVSVLPLSELYAACSYTPTVGGQWMYCENGECWSRSLWTSDGKLVEGSVSSGCRLENPT